MLSSKDIFNKKVYLTNKKGADRRFGRVRAVVFHPSKPKAVGVLVKRPDAALMVKRKERFVAFDRLQPLEDGNWHIVDESDSWDKAACKRLGVDLDECILWDLMPVRTDKGRELGSINSVYFDENTFAIDHIDISANGAERGLLGAANIAGEYLLGYNEGCIVVRDEVGEVTVAGGLAAKAGESWATAKHNVKESQDNLTEKTGEAVNKGAYKLGEAIGSLKSAAVETKEVFTETSGIGVDKAKKPAETAEEKPAAKKAEQPKKQEPKSGADKAAFALGKQLGRASHMFKDFKDEYNKASRGE